MLIQIYTFVWGNFWHFRKNGILILYCHYNSLFFFFFFPSLLVNVRFFWYLAWIIVNYFSRVDHSLIISFRNIPFPYILLEFLPIWIVALERNIMANVSHMRFSSYSYISLQVIVYHFQLFSSVPTLENVFIKFCFWECEEKRCFSVSFQKLCDERWFAFATLT